MTHGPAASLLEGLSQAFLVSCPIALYTATSSGDRVAFRQINKKTGNRLRQQLVDEETGEPVESADKGRGYEVDKGVYLRDRGRGARGDRRRKLAHDRHRLLRPEGRDRRALRRQPLLSRCREDKVGLEAFAVIRDAMRGKGMVGLGRVVLAKRERVVMLQPRGNGLIGTTLRYPYEVRDERRLFRRHRRNQDSQGDARPRRAHPRHEDGQVRPLDLPRPLRRGDRHLINEKKAGLPVATQRQAPRVVGGDRSDGGASP